MSDTVANILYVHHNPDLYGASRSLLRLVQALPRDRFRPVVMLAEDGPLRQRLEELEVEVLVEPVSVITRPVFRSPRVVSFVLGIPLSVCRIRRLIRRKNIHLVHTNTGIIVSAGLAARLAGVPHVWHVREWFQEFRAVWGLYARFMGWCSCRLIAISRSVAGQFPPGFRVEVVFNGLSLDEFEVPKETFRRQFRDRYGLGEAFVVGCVGRIKFVRKGQEILVRAAALLERKGLSAKYLIVGAPFTGNERHWADLRELIRSLGLEDRVVLTGHLEDPRPAYAAMDLFVLPSAQPEPLGGVVMEAMAMGLPVIASNIGGSTDTVADGVTGFLVPPSDPESLAGKIEILMRDESLRQRMGKAGPDRIAEVFSMDRMIRRITGIYDDALDRRGRFLGETDRAEPNQSRR